MGSLGANSDGTLRWIHFRGRLKSCIYGAPVYTAGPPTVFPITSIGTAFDVADYSQMASFSDYRIISWGVRITSVGKALDSQGWLTIVTGATGGAADLDPNSLTITKDVIPIQNGMDVVWFGKPNDQGALQYRTLNSVEVFDTNDWTSCTIFAQGCSTDVVLRYELVFDVEFLPILGTVMTRVATDAAPYNIAALSNAFNAFHGTHVESGVGESALRESKFHNASPSANAPMVSGFTDGMYSIARGLTASAAGYVAANTLRAVQDARVRPYRGYAGTMA